MSKLEGISITVDCDVLQGDGGTRTASVTGGFVALVLAFRSLMEKGLIKEMPVSTYVSGISAGIVGGVPMLDLQYYEDSRADVDLNCIMDGNSNIIELQGTGEGRPFSVEEAAQLVELCRKGNQVLQQKQKEILGELV